MQLRALISACCSVLVLSLASEAAIAACTKLAFSVNDYGKQGPTDDAKTLLDKYIAKWTAERGITKYNTGKKDVTCELFLDFGVFDEHTCKAVANVCWEGPMPAAVTAAGPAVGTKAKPAPKAAAAKPAGAAVTTGSIAAPATPAPAAAVPKPQ